MKKNVLRRAHALDSLKVNVLSVLNVLKQVKSRLRASTLEKTERTQTYSKLERKDDEQKHVY